MPYLVCRLLLEKNFFNDTATTEIYTLSLHDALPILVDVFAGQPYLTPTYLMDRGSDTHQLTLEEIGRAHV